MDNVPGNFPRSGISTTAAERLRAGSPCAGPSLLPEEPLPQGLAWERRVQRGGRGSVGRATGGAHIPLGVHGLLCAQQRPGQDREEPQAHLGVSVWLQAAPEDGDQMGQCFPEGRAWNRTAGSCPHGRQVSSPPAGGVTPPHCGCDYQRKVTRTFSPLTPITHFVNFLLLMFSQIKLKPNNILSINKSQLLKERWDSLNAMPGSQAMRTPLPMRALLHREGVRGNTVRGLGCAAMLSGVGMRGASYTSP